MTDTEKQLLYCLLIIKSVQTFREPRRTTTVEDLRAIQDDITALMRKIPDDNTLDRCVEEMHEWQIATMRCLTKPSRVGYKSGRAKAENSGARSPSHPG